MSDVEKDGTDENPETHDEDASLNPESGDLHDDLTIPPAAARTSADAPGVHDDATLPPKSGSGPFEDTVDMPASADGSAKAATDPGTRVRYFGDYELLDEIARGGMGVVYKARQVNLNRVVALKMILTGELASEEDVQRFYTEAEAAAKLEHPGIVPIFEIGEHTGQHFFSMGFIDGESLADQVKEGPLPPRDAASITKQVAEAIAFAHQNNVIHRDLKPANVLIDRNGQAKVTDFGLAKQTDAGAELTGTGQILGTPGYMPPEQAAGDTDRIGPGADIYSLGAVLYALLTGRAPFQSASVMDTLMQVLEKEPVAPRELNSAVDQDLETICLKCLQKEPGQRYQTAGELSADLERYLNGEAVLARPISQTARLWRWCKRNRTIATLTATVSSGVNWNVSPCIAPRTAQAAMRHSTIDLTMNVYTDPKLLDVKGALESLPSLPLDAARPEAQRATGTDDANSWLAPVLAPKPDKTSGSWATAGTTRVGDNTQDCQQQNDASVRSGKRKRPLSSADNGRQEVERKGLEPSTSALRTQRSPN